MIRRENRVNREKFKRIKFLVLDFDGVMTDNLVLIDDKGNESVFCNRSDGLGIELLKKKIGIIVLSKEKGNIAKARCKKLGIPCFNGLKDKSRFLIMEAKRRNLSLKNVCFIGNDINDIGCIKLAGIGVAVADAHPEVIKSGNFITKKKGGEGAVREVIDLILKC